MVNVETRALKTYVSRNAKYFDHDDLFAISNEDGLSSLHKLTREMEKTL